MELTISWYRKGKRMVQKFWIDVINFIRQKIKMVSMMGIGINSFLTFIYNIWDTCFLIMSSGLEILQGNIFLIM